MAHPVKEHATLLSVESLLKMGWHKDTSVPIKGAKEYAPDGSWIEDKRFEVMLQERKELLSEERVAKLGTLSRCEWKPELGKCELMKHYGKFWQTIGHTENKVNYLYPEEALLLLDSGMLEVYYEGLPLTVQQVYSTFIGHHVSIETYQTYSFLSRYGFILRRHDPDRIVTEYERQLGIDQYSKSRKKKNTLETKPLEKDISGIPVIASDHEKSLPSPHPSPSTPSSNSPKPKTKVSQETQVSTQDNKSSEGTTHKKHTSRGYTKWNWKDIHLPCIANRTTITLKEPNPDLLPCCVQYDRQKYTLEVNSLKRGRKWDGEYELSLGGSSWKGNVQAENWGEHRVKYRKYLDEYSLKSSPAGHLWKGKVQPLVKPQDAKSAGDIMKKLQVIESVQITSPNFSLGRDYSEQPRLKIDFDVHLPNSKFKKSSRSSPNHHICVLNSSDPFPSLAELTVLSGKCQPRAPLHFAVVDNGDISFYSFHDVCLPTDKI